MMEALLPSKVMRNPPSTRDDSTERSFLRETWARIARYLKMSAFSMSGWVRGQSFHPLKIMIFAFGCSSTAIVFIMYQRRSSIIVPGDQRTRACHSNGDMDDRLW